MFSSRSARDREPNTLSSELYRLRSLGVSVLDLTESNPTRAGLRYDSQRILAALAQPAALVYEPEARGAERARQAVAELYAEQGLSIGSERVVLTASTSEAYGALFKLLCDPGDEVLVPAPSYPLFEHLASFEGVIARSYPLGFDTSWFIDVSEIRSRLSARTRAVIVVSPNNPTGNYLLRAELAELATLGTPLICDEVFATFPIAPPATRATSVLEAESCLTFALSGLSKLAALPQMKLAWTLVGGPEALASEAVARLELILDAYLSPSTPTLVALPELLAARHVTANDVLARVQRNAGALRTRVADSAVTLLPVQGGWYALLRLPATLSEEEWVLGLLRGEQLLVQPGYFYDFASEAFVVLSLLTPEAALDEGIERLLRYVQRHT